MIQPILITMVPSRAATLLEETIIRLVSSRMMEKKRAYEKQVIEDRKTPEYHEEAQKFFNLFKDKGKRRRSEDLRLETPPRTSFKLPVSTPLKEGQ